MAVTIPVNFIQVFETYSQLLAAPNPGGFAWVVDASEDTTVTTGSALYYWKDQWIKKYEMEVMDKPTTKLTNLNIVKKLSSSAGKLFYDGTQLALSTDIGSIVNEIAPALITQAVDTTVSPIVSSIVANAMEDIVSGLNTAIGESASTLRGEFGAADVSTLSTANSNIATAKTEVLGAVVKSASNTNSIAASVDSVTRDLTMSVRIATTTGNRASVSSAGLFVSKELPADAANNDIAIFNGTAWVKMALSSIPSTLGWTTV